MEKTSENGSNAPVFSLLPDHPAKTDEFGSHDRVAKGIAGLIINGDGGKTIGIEGQWGSGKSTIVRFLKHQFASDENVLVVIFDAWAHEGDPLRRSFLEQLIIQLIDAKWVPKEKWLQLIEKLAKRKIDTHSKISRGVTSTGKIIAFAAALVPVGAIMIDFDEAWSRANLIGSIFVSAPVIVFSIIGAVNIVRNWFEMKSLHFLESDSDEEIYSSVSQDPDPTSIEFHKNFEDLVEDALRGNESRKLVLVIDNLDRIHDSGARTIWSTLRVFLEGPTMMPGRLLSRTWVVVPYDRSALKPSGQDKLPGFDSFKDKVIQSTFYAPSPVLSDWQSFLVAKLNEAFPNSSDEFQEQFHRLYRLYAIHHSTHERMVTPRDLILYVNEIGSLYCQWQDKLPLPEIAYYVILRREECDITNELIKGTIPRKNSAPLLGEHPIQDLAAAHYNVDQKKASQFLLRDSIAAFLEKGTASELRDLLNTHNEARYVLDSTLPELTNDWLPTETQNFFNCVRALSGCLDLFSGPRKAVVVNEIVSASRRIDVWTTFNNQTVDGIEEILALNDGLSGSISNSLAQSLNASISPGGAVFQWPDAVRPLIRLLAALKSCKDHKFETFKISTSAETWITVAAELVRHDATGVYWAYLHPELEETDSLDELLLRCFNEVEVPKGAIDGLRISLKVEEGDDETSVDRSQLLEQIRQRLSTPNTVEPKAVHTYVEALYMLSKNQNKAKLQADWAQSGMALHYLYHCLQAKEFLSTANCMFMHLSIFPSIVGHTQQHNSPQGEQALKNIVQNPSENSGLLESFIGLIENRGRRRTTIGEMLPIAPDGAKFAAYCLNQMRFPEYTFTDEKFLENWPLLIEQVEQNNLQSTVYQKIVDYQLTEHELQRKLCEKGFDIESGALYMNVLQSVEANNVVLAKWLGDGISTLTQTQYREIIESNRSMLQLFLEIGNHTPDFSLSTAFCDAVVENGVRAISGGGDIAWNDDLRMQLFNLVETDQRKTMQDQLRNEATKAEGKVSHEFFDRYGAEISDLESLHGDNSIISDFFSDLIKERNEAGIQWLIEIVGDTDFLANYKPKYHVPAFKKRVREALEVDSDTDSSLVELGSVLGIKRPKGDSDAKSGKP